MADQDASGIGCPQCGASLDFTEGALTVTCGSCHTPLAVSGAAGITRYYLEERLDLAGAKAAARRFLATNGIDEAVAAQLRYETGELCFLPFWRLRGHASGWQWSERETVIVEDGVDDSGRPCRRETKGSPEQEAEILAFPVDYSSPACDLSPYGLAGIATVSSVLPLKGMSYALLAGRGTVFDPVKEAEQVRREATALGRERSHRNGTIRSENHLVICGEQLALISYPVWKLGFSRGARLYQLVVDGVNGRILKARFPGRARLRLATPLASVALLVYAFSLHMVAGVVAVALLLARLAARGELSPAGVLRFFCSLIKQGDEVEHG